MITKICSKCKRDLPLIFFSADKRREHGVTSQCENCKREYRQQNKERLLIAQYQRRRGKQDLCPKRKAWNALYYALRIGKASKKDMCEVCREYIGQDKIQGHHEDYSKPLVVLWCCQTCHAKLDKERKHKVS